MPEAADTTVPAKQPEELSGKLPADALTGLVMHDHSQGQRGESQSACREDTRDDGMQSYIVTELQLLLG